MSIKEAKLIISEYDLNTDEDTFEVVLEVINKFGSARKVLMEGLKPDYKYLKKLSKLLAMLDEKETFDGEAEEISIVMHSIYKKVSKDSESSGEDFNSLLARVKVHHLPQMQRWVINDIGGRKMIGKVTLQEPNQLRRQILNSIKKYQRLEELPNLAIENKLKSIGQL
ncbi:hypothetical protein [Sulfurimonas sp.]|uniref:hypothetical protein n=1 Tax=Sulfurimonas sp. TaxID=2022749 RepID=UPI002B477143|nr:hypothetical protein [Sulfurimonas sp.]